ncbi:MAG: PAS domain S-box protein [Chloroflexota bacterium]|nr:PAS domain S-box protein [Chloroflexota bacterium]
MNYPLAISSVLTLFWARLTEPGAEIDKPRARYRARLAASVFLLSLSFLIIHTLVDHFISQNVPLVYPLATIPFTLYFLLSRTRYHEWVIGIGIASMVMLPPIAVQFVTESVHASFRFLLIWTVMGVALSYLFYGVRTSLFILVGSMAGIVTMGQTVTPTDMPVALGWAMQLLLVLFLLMAINRYQNDIAVRRLAHESGEDRLTRRIIDNVADVVLMMNGDLHIQYINQAATALLGYQADEYEGRSLNAVFELMHPDDVPHMMAKLKDVLANNSSIRTEYRLRHKEGHYIWLETISNFVFAPNGAVDAVIFTGRDITARKAADVEYKRSQQYYATLVNSIEGVIWEIDAETYQTTFVSPQVRQMLGYTPEQIINDPYFWIYRVHPDHWHDMMMKNNSAITERKGFTIEYRLTGADGDVRWIRSHVSPVLENDEVRRLISVNYDVTEQKERERSLKAAQAAAQEQRAFADALRDSTSDLTRMMEPEEIFDRILALARDLFAPDGTNIMMIEGDSVQIVRQMGYEEYSVPKDFESLRFALADIPNLQRMLTSNAPYVIEDVASYQDWFYTDWSTWIRSNVGAPIRVNDKIVGFIVLDSHLPHAFDSKTAERLQAFADQAAIAIHNADLYGQVKRYAEELEALIAERTLALEQERQLLSAILNSMAEGVAYTQGLDEDEETLYLNHAFMRLTGYTADDIQKSTPGLLRHLRAEVDEELETDSHVYRKLDVNGHWTEEVRLRRKDGSEFDATVTTSRVNDAEGAMTGSVTVIRDISQEKALAEQRARFIAHASHELRTPITNLITRLYLIRKRPEDATTHLDVLDQVSRRMKRLVDDLLDVSRLERGVITLKRAPVQLNELLKPIVEIQAAEAALKHVTLTYGNEGTADVTVFADRERLTQVVTNLIINAINYTPDGGDVVVYLHQNEETKQAEIIVEDTGVGIPEEHLPHIFDPFFRVPTENGVKGSGLGLSISNDLVTMHGGTIHVESGVGAGSRFIVRLPLSEGESLL